MTSAAPAHHDPAPGTGRTLNRHDLVVIIGSVVAIALAGITHFVGGGAILAFVCSAAAVALLASLVGTSVEQLGDRFGPGATGVLQSALGNLPELFISLFALKAGLVAMVQAALIGSILSNLLLVLGLAFIVGGLKHGAQRIGSESARSITVMLVLSVSAMVIPSIAHLVHAPAANHERALSLIVAVVLLGLFCLQLPASIRKKSSSGEGAEVAAADDAEARATEHEAPRWPLPLAIGLLAAASLAAAAVSDWFVSALTPAMEALHISEAFAGLVIVAIAGNAIENVVGLQLAARNRSEYAYSVVINSPLQISLALAPLLVILSMVLGLTPLTLVFSPMLVVSVVLAVLIQAFITFDGESNWLEGAAMVALYLMIAASFWWG